MVRFIHYIQLSQQVRATNLKLNYGVKNGLVKNFMAKDYKAIYRMEGEETFEKTNRGT